MLHACKRYQSFVIFIILLGMQSIVLYPVTIKEIKDTYTILSDDYKHCSPAHGALWWERRILKNYYDFGNPEHATVKLIRDLFHVVQGSFSITHNKSYPGAHFSVTTVGKIVGVMATGAESTPADLVRKLQAVIEQDIDFKASLDLTAAVQVELTATLGTLKERKKEVVKIKGLPDYVKCVKEIPDVIKAIQKFEEKAVRPTVPLDIQHNLEILGQNKNLLEAKLEAKKEPVLENKDLEANITNALDKLKFYIKKLDTLKPSQESLKKAYLDKQALEKSIEEFETKLANNNAKKVKERLKSLTLNIAQSLVECGFFEKTDEKRETKVLYYPGTTFNIFMGFLYRKAETKKQLKQYFEQLTQFVPAEKLFQDAEAFTDAAWEDDIFNADDVPTIVEALKTYVKQSEKEKNPLNVIKKLFTIATYEEIIFAEIMQQIYSMPLPKIASHRNVAFEERTFPDCVETTMRNLCNCLFYNQENRSLAISNLDPDLKITSDMIDQTCKDFYEENSKAEDLEKNSVHQAWQVVVENLPFVAYIRAVEEKSDREVRGYEFVSGVDRKQLEQETKVPLTEVSVEFSTENKQTFPALTCGVNNFVFVDQDRFKTYELQPSLKNIIILFNRIFGLNLYDNQLEPLINQKFNSIYFPVLCKKLGWEYSVKSDDELDIKDFGNERWDLPLVVGKSDQHKIVLLLNQRHAEIQRSEGFSFTYHQTIADAIFDILDTPEIASQLSSQQQGLYANLLIPYLFWEIQFFKPAPKDSMLKYHIWFSVDLEDRKVKKEVIEQIFTSLETADYGFAIALMRSIPLFDDLVNQKELIDMFAKHPSVLKDPLVLKEFARIVDDIFRRPRCAAKTEIIRAIFNITSIEDESFKKDFYTRALAYAESYKDYPNAAQIFFSFAKRDMHLDRALSVAQEFLAVSVGEKEPESSIERVDKTILSKIASSIFKELFKKNIGFEIVIKYIPSFKVIFSGHRDLISELIKYDKGVPEIINQAKYLMKVDAKGVESEAEGIELFNRLFKGNCGIYAAKIFIEELLDEKTSKNSVKAAKLIILLCENHHGEEVTEYIPGILRYWLSDENEDDIEDIVFDIFEYAKNLLGHWVQSLDIPEDEKAERMQEISEMKGEATFDRAKAFCVKYGIIELEPRFNE